MNGISVMIDTNIAIALLNGEKKLAEMLDGKDVRISFITELELLCKPNLKDAEKNRIPGIPDPISACTYFDKFCPRSVVNIGQLAMICNH